MNFNKKNYLKYRRSASRIEKLGVFDVTRFPNGLYCFATKQKLGDNGRLENHSLLGKKVINEKGKTFTIDSVCIHWYDGYYYHATLCDENNSHKTVIFENINSKSEIIIKSVKEYCEEFKILNN